VSEGRPADAVSSAADDGAALAALLRTILRDVAHELRGPVQSAVVNLEVLRRRAAAGKLEDVPGRADVVEAEVRRMHGLADAFLGLLREPAAEPVTVTAEKLLAGAILLIDVVARSCRVRWECDALSVDVLIHVRPEPAVLAIVSQCVAAVHAAGEGGTVRVQARSEPDAFVMEIVAETEAAREADASLMAAPREAIEGWLELAGGTVLLGTGSDTRSASAVLTLRRAT